MPESSLATATQSARKIIPHFPSNSILATIRYYREVLHFNVGEAQFLRPETSEPTFVSVSAGEQAAANIYFFLTSHSTRKLSPGNIMIEMSTDGLEQYYNLLKEEGKVIFVEEIEDKEWGYRQFEIVDGDGNHIQFFRFLDD
jgi:uncharacterized glyoxalase superfamily protein PhnB